MEKSETDMSFRNIVNEKGIVTGWPKKRDERIAVLHPIRSKIEKGWSDSEKEINEILNEGQRYKDPALIRRMMYDQFFIERAETGSQYWIDDSSGDSGKGARGLSR